MTYTAQSKKFGKEAVQIVELHIPRCSLTYGVAPCTAAMGVTGSAKCFNCFAACQDQANYAQADFVYRFSTVRLDGLQLPGDPPTFPTVIAVDSASSVLTPGKGLGVRSSVKVQLCDHPWTDVGIDKYVLERTYDPDQRGTFWGKFLARNRYYLNRLMVVRTGYLTDAGGYDPANFTSRSYLITAIDGPDNKGTISITAKDPLKLADGEKSKLPQASSAKLVSDITNTDTTITISPADDLTQWWAWGQRYIRIEDELMSVTAQTGIGTTTAVLTVVRGDQPLRYEPSLNITAEHKAAAGVQPCFWFPEQMVYDIVYFLLHDIAGIDPAYLDYAGWKAHIDSEYPYLSFSALISEPVDVKKMLVEITELGVYIWWHDRDQLVKLHGVRPASGSLANLNENANLVADSVAVGSDNAALVTQAWLMYDLNFPTSNMTQLKNYRVVDVRSNLDRETDVEYGYPAINSVATRWLTRADFSVAVQINGNLLQQYQDIRRLISFQIDPKDANFWTGDIITVATRYWQDDTGNPKLLSYLVTQMEEVGGPQGIQYNVTAMEVFTVTRGAPKITHPALTGDSTPPPDDYDIASPTDRAEWVYISKDDGTMSDGSPAYQMV